MSSYVLGFQDIDTTTIILVGGKGANLGELSSIEGIHVPDGFCVSTEAFRSIIGAAPSLAQLLDRLALLRVDDRADIARLSGEIRAIIEGIAIPHDMRAEIGHHLARLGAHAAYAVRSSATAEDGPTASFAGQQDTYLNVIGEAAILRHISRCWASLFTERAVIYRLQNGFDHRHVYLAVVVQKMVFPHAAGTLFTADPVTSNRRVVSIDASFGLGEALVGGRVNADSYRVRDDTIIARTVATKKLAIHAVAGGGTAEQEIAPEQQNRPALTDEQILRLARIGRRIEEHFGSPQDIEWCLDDDTVYVVQSRPITTLFPIPETNDGEKHVYISVGHQQMMTDAMKPLGLSFYLLTTRAPMRTAGGRLFVDVAAMLAAPAGRKTLIETLGKSDPLIQDALRTIVERGDIVPIVPDVQPEGGSTTAPPARYETLHDYDPAVVDTLIHRAQASVAELTRAIATRSGSDLFDFILEDIPRLQAVLSDPQGFGVIMTGMNAAAWINEQMEAWLGETNAADTLAQSVPNNITSEMGLRLMDVADVLRPYPAVVVYLRQARDEGFLDGLDALHGGEEARQAIQAFLDRYGMRCVGEIDITRPRWSEQPTALVPMILTNVATFGPGAGQQRFEQGRQEASHKEQEVLERLRQLPDGEGKARATKRMIDLLRTLSGYREYPKYSMVSRYYVYKQAILTEAERLVEAGVLHTPEDCFFLTFDELREVVRTATLDDQLISQRKEQYRFYQKLRPPRVLTSDGEIFAGAYRRGNLPAGAIAGLAVSSGVVEGRARVILRTEDATLEDGDILVTAFTDPSWTPLFVSIRGLVTEVGGLMTHGAVIAREYGVPAVVGVENATRLIQDGQRIRVHGTAGYIELL